MKNNYVYLVSFGVLSGVVVTIVAVRGLLPGSLGLTIHNFADSFALYGLLFGLVTGIYFVQISSRQNLFARYVSWVLASGASYFLAVGVATFIYSDFFSSYAVSYALGGLAGSLIVSVAFHFIFHRLTLSRHIAVLILGTFIPYAVRLLLIPMLALDYYWEEVPLYLLWQTVITTTLGISLRSKQS